MFKLHKFLSLTIISITPIPACFFSITSCSNYAVGPDYKSSYADFINTRTFSILSNNNDKSHVGTGWIFRKSCKSLYTYYLATNVHVAALFSVSGSEIPMQLAYNPDYSIRTCFQPESYFKVESYVLLGENSDNRPTKSN
jgi:hypothetical protein